jgi:hypothetical protein
VDVAARAHTGGEIRPANLTGREFHRPAEGVAPYLLARRCDPAADLPDLPLWRLPIFRDPEWHAFAEAVRDCQEAEEEPADMRMRAVMPAIAEAVHGATRAAMASQTGVVLRGKVFHRWMPKRLSKNLAATTYNFYHFGEKA